MTFFQFLTEKKFFQTFFSFIITDFVYLFLNKHFLNFEKNLEINLLFVQKVKKNDKIIK